MRGSEDEPVADERAAAEEQPVQRDGRLPRELARVHVCAADDPPVGPAVPECPAHAFVRCPLVERAGHRSRTTPPHAITAVVFVARRPPSPSALSSIVSAVVARELVERAFFAPSDRGWRRDQVRPRVLGVRSAGRLAAFRPF